VRFTSRFYFEGDKIEADAEADDPIAKFIGSVERSEKAFQRMLSRRKVRDIVNFYESAETQPALPGSVLLFSEDVLDFKPIGQFASVGNLEDPKSGFLIIDGQHRLAGLHFYGAKNPSLLDQIEVPCVIFDGKTAEFAAEMFVIINLRRRASTDHTSWTCSTASAGTTTKHGLPRFWSENCTRRRRRPSIQDQQAWRAEPSGKVDPSGGVV
jgi:hypothetical protein